MVTNRNFKGVWIPKLILLDQNLTWMEKLFITEINSLDGDKGCFASNGHFSDFFGLSKQRCSQIVKRLEKKKYISVAYQIDGKRIQKRVLRIFDRGIKNTRGGYQEYAKGINTVNNTKRGQARPISLEIATQYFKQIECLNYQTEAQKFYSYYEANGWIQGKGKKIKDWKAAARGWKLRSQEFKTQQSEAKPQEIKVYKG